MKKILNWTLGGFFRTLGRILVYLLLGGAISYIISVSGFKLPSFLTIMKVNASTSVIPSSYYHKLEYSVGECLTSGCEDFSLEDIRESSWFTQQLTNFCPSGKTCKLRKDWYETTYSTSLDSGRTYTINFDTWISDRDTLNYYLQTQFYFTASNTGAYNGSSSSYISSFTCRAGLIEGTTSRVSWSCSFTPSTPINYLYIRMQYPYSTTSFYSYGCNKGEVLYDNSQTDAINQQTTIIQDSTTNIINNNNENTQNIINNNNENTQQIIDSNKACIIYDKSSIVTDNYYITYQTGGLISSLDFGVSGYIPINSNDTITILKEDLRWQVAGTCFYDSSKVKISCVANKDYVTNSIISIPVNSSYVRFTFHKNNNIPVYQICKNGNQAIQDAITDDNVDESIGEANDFFSSFTTNTHGLTGIITAPLNAIQSLTSATCSPLVLPLPFVNEDLTLPCMRDIYVQNFGGFMNIYDAITLGIISYWIMVRIFALVKDFKNPDHDEIEVVDL